MVSFLLSVSNSILPSSQVSYSPCCSSSTSLYCTVSFTFIAFPVAHVFNPACPSLHLLITFICDRFYNWAHDFAFAVGHIFVNPLSINIVFTVPVSLRITDMCPSKRLGHKLKWWSHGQTHIILCSISMAAWKPKSPHKLLCYLGQTSVSK